MSRPIAAWRVTYTPGDWLVLSGPTSLVVMMPAPARMSSLVSDLWSVVVRAGSIDELTQRLASFGLSAMPSLGVLFWDEAGLHSLVRGKVKLVDADSGETVADGENVVTWTETPLGEERRLRLDLQPVEADALLQMPLLVGAVAASSVLVTTEQDARIEFPDEERAGVLTGVGSPLAAAGTPDGTADGMAVAAVGAAGLGAVVTSDAAYAGDDEHDADDEWPGGQAPGGAHAQQEPGLDHAAEPTEEHALAEPDAPVADVESSALSEDSDGLDDFAHSEVTSDDEQQWSAGDADHEAADLQTGDEDDLADGQDALDESVDADAQPWPPTEAHDDAEAWERDGSGSETGRQDDDADRESADESDHEVADERFTEEAPPADMFADAASAAGARFGVHEDPVMGEPEPYQPYQPEEVRQPGGQDELPVPQPAPAPRWEEDSSSSVPVGDSASESGARYASPDEADEVSGDTVLGGPGRAPYGPPPGMAVPPPVTAVPPPPGLPGMPPGMAGVPSVAGPSASSPSSARRWGPPPEGSGQQISAEAPVADAARQSLGDHDGETVFATALASTHKPQLQNRADDSLVLAAICAAGHPNPPGSRRCRLCPAPVDTANPRLVARPVLASVRTNAGEAVQLNRPVIVGRAPEMKGETDATLLRVPSPSTDISRNHLRVSSHDWNIELTDLHSTNGTILHAPGEPPVRLTGGESVLADLGTVLDLGDGVKLRIEPPLT